MDKYELILRVSKVIDDERESMKKEVLAFDRKYCPETSPDYSRFELRLGSSEYFLAQMNALADLNGIDAGGMDVLRSYWDGSLKDSELLSYQNTTRCLIYHYLNERKDVKPTGDPPRLMHREITELISAIRDEGAGWDTGIKEGSYMYHGQALGKYLVFHPFFPEDMIDHLKGKIKIEIEKYEESLENKPGSSKEFRKDFEIFRKALIDFPEEFNQHTGKYTEYGEGQYDMEFLKEKAVHEITHNFLHRQANLRNQSKAVKSLNEGFAWFSHLYTRNGFEKPVVTAGDSVYEDPEEIRWLTNLINSRARDHFRTPREVTPVDWARKKGVEVFTGERSVRFNFLQFIKPESVKKELQNLEEILEDVEKAKEDVKKEIEFEKKQIYRNFPKESLSDLTPNKREIKLEMAEKNPGRFNLDALSSDYQLLYSHLYKLEKDLRESKNPAKAINSVEKSMEEFFWEKKPGYEKIKDFYEEKLGSALVQEKNSLEKMNEDLKTIYREFNRSDNRPTIENLERLMNELEKSIKEIDKILEKISP